MKNVGIIGAGPAGLQLALLLQKHGIAATLYSDRTPAEILNSRLPNTPARFPLTLERERALGVSHWDQTGVNTQQTYFYIHGPQPIQFVSNSSSSLSWVDPRLYAATLLEDFQQRGGDVRIGKVGEAELAALAEVHDLLVIAAGKADLTGIFARDDARSPYNAPQRKLIAGYFTGIKQHDPIGMTFNISPGHGEIFQAAFHTPDGPKANLLIEGIPGQGFEAVTSLRYEDDPAAFLQALLGVLEAHAPTIFARINPAEFGVTDPQDIVQGSVTPVTRHGFVELAPGRFALALGDVRVTQDPVAGMGLNAASIQAWEAGQAIINAAQFDRAFVENLSEHLWQSIEGMVLFSNALLAPPPPHVIDLFVAAMMHQTVADAFVEEFATPNKIWGTISDPARTAAFIQENAAAPEMA